MPKGMDEAKFFTPILSFSIPLSFSPFFLHPVKGNEGLGMEQETKGRWISEALAYSNDGGKVRLRGREGREGECRSPFCSLSLHTHNALCPKP